MLTYICCRAPLASVEAERCLSSARRTDRGHRWCPRADQPLGLSEPAPIVAGQAWLCSRPGSVGLEQPWQIVDQAAHPEDQTGGFERRLNEDLGRDHVESNGQQLPWGGEDHFLVVDEAGQPQAVDAHFAHPRAAGRPREVWSRVGSGPGTRLIRSAVSSAVPEGASCLVEGCPSTISTSPMKRLTSSTQRNIRWPARVRLGARSRPRPCRSATRPSSSTTAGARPVVASTTAAPASSAARQNVGETSGAL